LTHAKASPADAPVQETDMQHTPSPSLPRWRAALAATVALAATLVACGGGGGDAGTPVVGGGTTPAPAAASSYTLGAIDGFGSVVVGGVRFDDSSATVEDEDGVAHASSALKLGMLVQLDAKNVDRALGTAVAQRIRFGSEIVGPVGSIDTTASTVLVLGQTVLVTTSTVFDITLSGGLSALTAGAVIEVHGILDEATGRVTATRIEPKTGATAYRLRGVVSSYDAAAKTFKIGSELISFASVTAVPATLANGRVVRVLLQTTQVAGAWVATKIGLGVRGPATGISDAHVEGAITAFTSTAAFEVNGLKVDASSAAFPDGSAGVVLGARVEVTGSVVAGVLVATKVEIEEAREHGMRPLELHGDIASIDTTAKTFALRGVTVWYGGTVSYKNGAAADLAAGKRVEVHGTLSADRTRLEARRIEFKS
jgi:hypothetical protein